MRKLFLACVLAFPLALVAQQRIAVVNTQEIMAALPDVKTADKKLQDLQKQYSADLEAMQKELQTKAETFEKEQATLAEAIRTRRQQELQDINLRIQQSYQAMQEDLQKQQQTLLAPIQSKVQTAIQRVAEANGATYVLEHGALLAVGKDALNLTEKVLTDLGVKK